MLKSMKCPENVKVPKANELKIKSNIKSINETKLCFAATSMKCLAITK